jgi:hypothetical protein
MRQWRQVTACVVGTIRAIYNRPAQRSDIGKAN